MSQTEIHNNTAPAEVETAVSSENGKRHIDSIDALRGVACLMVLFGHCQQWFHEPSFDRWKVGSLNISPHHWLRYGQGGVDLFFVLSGFCLAYPILIRSGKGIDWKRYAINRICRILPPYWAALMLFAGLSFTIAHYRIVPLYKTGILEMPSARQFVYSLTLISTSFNRSFWTLPIEWRWYFLLPALIVVWRRFGSVGVICCTTLLSVLYLFVFGPMLNIRVAFILTALPAWLPLFGFGIWAADLATHRTSSRFAQFLIRNVRWGILISLIRIAFLHIPAESVSDFSPWWYVARVWTWGPLWFFVVLAATRDLRIQRCLSWRPLVNVGLFSYSLYLTHEPLLRFAASIIIPMHWPDTLQFAFHEILLPFLLIGFGYLFYLVAEKPFLRKRGQAIAIRGAGSPSIIEQLWINRHNH